MSHFLYWYCFVLYHHLKNVKTTPTTAKLSRFSCVQLCDPIDGSPPGSPIPGILQARTLEWVAISFSNAWKWEVKVKSLSRVRLFATPWTAAYQAPLSMAFFQARVLEWGAIAFLRAAQKQTSSQTGAEWPQFASPKKWQESFLLGKKKRHFNKCIY